MPGHSEPVVAYAPFLTFLAAIDALARRPDYDRVDTSVWPNYSTAIRAQLVGSFRFLGLIDEAGRPTPSLKSLVRDKANRKTTMRKVIEASYARIIKLGLTRISRRQFEDAMRQYGMKGETHNKVISFFLQAARYSGLPLSPLLLRKTREARSSRPRRAVDSAEVQTSNGKVENRDVSATVTSRSIVLTSGGIVTVTAEGNIVDMADGDRELVLRLFDQLREYEKKKKV